MNSNDISYNALKWRSRRGKLELDYILNSFIESEYLHLNNQFKGKYCKLLENEDPLLEKWLILNEPPSEEFAFIINKILACAKNNNIN